MTCAGPMQVTGSDTSIGSRGCGVERAEGVASPYVTPPFSPLPGIPFSVVSAVTCSPSIHTHRPWQTSPCWALRVGSPPLYDTSPSPCTTGEQPHPIPWERSHLCHPFRRTTKEIHPSTSDMPAGSNEPECALSYQVTHGGARGWRGICCARDQGHRLPATGYLSCDDGGSTVLGIRGHLLLAMGYLSCGYGESAVPEIRGHLLPAMGYLSCDGRRSSACDGAWGPGMAGDLMCQGSGGTFCFLWGTCHAMVGDLVIRRHHLPAMVVLGHLRWQGISCVRDQGAPSAYYGVPVI